MLYKFQFNYSIHVDAYNSKAYVFSNKREVLLYLGYHGQRCSNHLKEVFVLAREEYAIWDPITFWSRLV